MAAISVAERTRLITDRFSSFFREWVDQTPGDRITFLEESIDSPVSDRTIWVGIHYGTPRSGIKGGIIHIGKGAFKIGFLAALQGLANELFTGNYFDEPRHSGEYRHFLASHKPAESSRDGLYRVFAAAYFKCEDPNCLDLHSDARPFVVNTGHPIETPCFFCLPPDRRV